MHILIHTDSWRPHSSRPEDLKTQDPRIHIETLNEVGASRSRAYIKGASQTHGGFAATHLGGYKIGLQPLNLSPKLKPTRSSKQINQLTPKRLQRPQGRRSHAMLAGPEVPAFAVGAGIDRVRGVRIVGKCAVLRNHNAEDLQFRLRALSAIRVKASWFDMVAVCGHQIVLSEAHCCATALQGIWV